MKIGKRTRIVVPTVTALAAIGIGGVVWATTANADLEGSERDRVAAAATEAVGGTATDVESSDDPGEAYEVEVRLDDGSEVDVALSRDLDVVSRHVDDRDGTTDVDDRVLSDSERTAAEEAALTEVENGTVTQVEASDDGDTAFEVEVIDAAGRQWDVDLDADFTVLRSSVDD